MRNSETGKCLTSKPEPAKVVREHCRSNESHKPKDEDQWSHVLQAEPFPNAASVPTDAGYSYVTLANVNPDEKDSWKKSLNSQKTEATASRCLYASSVEVSSASRQAVQPSTKVREGSCMVSGARSSSRVFQFVNTSVADEYGIRSVWMLVGSLRLAGTTLRQQPTECP